MSMEKADARALKHLGKLCNRYRASVDYDRTHEAWVLSFTDERSHDIFMHFEPSNDHAGQWTLGGARMNRAAGFYLMASILLTGES